MSKSKKAKETPRVSDVIDSFLFLEAIDEKSAIELSQLGLNLNIYNAKIEKLILQETIKPVLVKDSEKFYLDFEKYESVRINERKKYFLTLVSIIIPAALILLLCLSWLIST